MHLVHVRHVQVHRVTPLLVRPADPLRAVTVERVEALGERFVENRDRQERAGDFDQVEPVVLHRRGPVASDSGTSSTTATGNVWSTRSA